MPNLRWRWGLVFLCALYLLGALPYLTNYPLIDWAQPMIAAPAAKLATQGVYGSDMFTGFYHAEERNYDHLPLYPLFVTLAFRLGGVGILQARLVSVGAGLMVLLATFALGRQLGGVRLGLLAAAFCLMRLALPNYDEVERLGYQLTQTGIPLIDFARVIRFDVLVPAWGALACLCFVEAVGRSARWGFIVAGGLIGCATLTHIYGGFILPLLCAAYVWHVGRTAWRHPALYLTLLGFGLTLLPYLIYVALGWPDYAGQMLRHETRFDLFNPDFYWHSLTTEPLRYLALFGGSFRQPILWPRVGLWVLVAGLPLASLWLWRERLSLPHRLLFLSLPVLLAQLALLINYKRYPYMSLLLPFIALQIAYVAQQLWEGSSGWKRLCLIGLGAALLVESGYGLVDSWQMARATTPYAALTQSLRQVIPPTARVLASHITWFALSDYPHFRSLNLPFVLSDPQYQYVVTPSLPEVLHDLAPDYIVVEERLLKSYTHPERLPGAKEVNEWRILDEYTQQHCQLVERLDAPDYGFPLIYACQPSE